MNLKLVDIKDPILRKKAKPVKRFDKKLERFVDDMRETLKSQKDPEGVGLAAPQVGKSLKIFLIDYEGEEDVVINPKIIKIGKVKHSKKAKKKQNELLEGCLSLPHYYGPLDRAEKITISYQNEKGSKKEKQFTGFLAQIVQHELDHLEGVIFIDRILEQSAPLYKFDGDEWEEVSLV